MRFGNVPAGYLTVPTDQAPADTTEVSSATNNRSFSVYRQVNMSVTHFAVPISRTNRIRLSGLAAEPPPGAVAHPEGCVAAAAPWCPPTKVDLAA